jgi:hypothetical protein
MSTTSSASSEADAPIKYVCGIDMASQSCSGCVTRPDKRVEVKPMTFANTKDGWSVWFDTLSQLDAAPEQILIGMEATSRDARESLSRVGAAWVDAVEVRIQGKRISFSGNKAYAPRRIGLMP